MRGPSLVLLLCLGALQSGCTSYLPLRYAADTPTASSAQAAPLVSVGVFLDTRGDRIAGNWLGETWLKILRTEKPTSEVVQDAYADGLRARGMLAEPADARFLVEGSIEKLDCSDYSNLEAHVHIDLRLLDAETRAEIYSWPYRQDDTEGGMGAGIFASVETLRVLAERTLRELVDRSLDDPPMRRALQSR